MQKFIAKYGLAAHLAFLAVAPLALFAFVDSTTLANVLLWLSVPALVWMLLEPSVRGEESLHSARRRVLRSVLRDPLFWASVAIVIMAAVRSVNTGVTLAYDAEKAVWSVSPAIFPILPGSVGEAGYLPFAVVVALTVLLQASRHSLGRSARHAFFVVASALAGLAMAIVLLSVAKGHAGALRLLTETDAAAASTGFTFGLFLLAGTVALVAVLENQWRAMAFVLTLTLGGTAAGAFLLAPTFASAAFAVTEVVVLAYSFIFANRALNAASGFKLLVFLSVSLAIGAALVVFLAPPAVFESRLAGYLELKFFADGFWAQRATLSAMAMKAWFSHLWIGTGLNSFPLDFRFAAQAADWAQFRLGATSVPNGWWQMLAERGLVGLCFYVLPFGFLIYGFIRRLVANWGAWRYLHPAALLAPALLVLLVADGFFEITPIQADAILAVGTTLAVSVASLPKGKRQGNGR